MPAPKLILTARPGDDAAPDGVLPFLMDDLSRALDVYARMAARNLGEDPETSVPRMVPLEAAPEGAGADALLLGIELDGGPGARARAEDVLAGALNRLEAGAPVYYLGVTALHSPEGVGGPVRDTCRERGLSYAGGLTVADADLMTRLTASPRMGLFRRPVSEAVDRLILALRSGTETPDELARPGLAGPLRLVFR